MKLSETTSNFNIETEARTLLFAAIEPGSAFWSNEIAIRGAEEVLNDIQDGFYDESRTGVEKIQATLINLSFDEIQNKIASAGADLIFPGDLLWPDSLGDLKNAPIGLTIKGTVQALPTLIKSVSIVGTRNPSNYGNRIAYDMASALAACSWSVVSGGALGIDSVAHFGAMDSGGVTASVLGGGVQNPYPIKNQKLFDEICEGGVLISEYLPDVRPMPHRFLIRNRLIAALSKATIVIEAAKRSGSIRTAHDAAEIFRLVMAVPGQINMATSEGCHKLIAERSAEIVTSVSDVLELVNPIA